MATMAMLDSPDLDSPQLRGKLAEIVRNDRGPIRNASPHETLQEKCGCGEYDQRAVVLRAVPELTLSPTLYVGDAQFGQFQSVDS